jgi:hypothetical protein
MKENTTKKQVESEFIKFIAIEIWANYT